MVRLCLAFVGLAYAACNSTEPASPPRSAPMLDPRDIEPLVAARLRELHATTTVELGGAAPARRLAAGTPSALPYSAGRSVLVPIVVRPGTLPIATEIGLRMTVAVDDRGVASVRESPTREEVAAAVRMTLDGEERALAAATHALDAAGHRPPTTWVRALRVIRLDPRLPAGQLAGAPTWQLIFDPWDEARGGYHHVLLSAPALAVLDVR